MANSCHVLQSLISMMLGHMWETHTDGDQCSSWYSSILISAHECYKFVFKELIDLVILYTHMCISKCNITALIFFRGYECWGGA